MSIDVNYSDGNDGNNFSDTLLDKGLNPHEKLIKKQKIRILREVVERLKPRYRELVVLRYFREYSYEEIAAHTDLPLGTVKAQLYRAREQLYNLMRDAKDRI
jgi:RNA polymerase sigma-70 factor (ECF subfamily)